MSEKKSKKRKLAARAEHMTEMMRLRRENSGENNDGGTLQLASGMIPVVPPVPVAPLVVSCSVSCSAPTS